MSDKTRLTALSVLLSSVLLTVFWLWSQTSTTPVASASRTQFACLSYAPYRLPGESPFINDGAVTPERIRADLTLLREHTNCVRTYAVSEGLDAVPPIAESLGMQVMQGIWIGRDHEENLAGISSALALVNRHPETVRALIVGNEVLLRREQTAERIAQYLRLAQQGTSVAVTYADVWEFWAVNAQLQREVDFVTVHILPYWEDHPVAIGHAVEHVAGIYRRVSDLFTGKRVFIGETGWPSIGRMRGPARPGRVEQARFVREWMVHAEQNQFTDYNLIEAFDQPWKRQLEGAMGGGWGLLASNGNQKFPMRGPVASRPGALGDGLRWGLGGAALMVLITLLPVRRAKTTNRSGAGVSLAGAAGFVTGALWPSQADYLAQWSRNPIEWTAGLLIVACGWLLTAMLPRLTPGVLIPGLAQPARPSPRAALPWLPWRMARLTVVFGMAFMMVLHVLDARYRGYPSVLYVPALVMLLTAWCSGAGTGRRAIEEKALAWISVLMVPLMLWPELPANTQSAGFSVVALLLALAMLLARAPGAANTLRSKTSKPSSKPSAPGSAA